MAAQISLIVVFSLLIVLIIVLLYTCKRTKKLEYRYMKLVESAGGDGDVECELPQVESCAVEVDAPEDDDLPEIVQSSNSKASNNNRSKAISKTKTKFRTIESDSRDRREGVDNAFFDASESPEMESLGQSRSSVL